MTHKTEHVANLFLQRAFKEKLGEISHMKLQKLIYFLHGWHMAIIGKPAINDQFEAWPYGPVIGSLYQKFKHYGSDNIKDYVCEFDPEKRENIAYVVGVKDRRFNEIFEAVWRKYSPLDALVLSTLTHQKDSPWDQTRKRGEKIISNELIRDYFRGLVQ